MRYAFLFSALLAVSAGANAVSSDIDTAFVNWDGSSYVCCFAEPNTATYGQTFKAPTVDTQLDSFTFHVDDFSDPDTVDFRAYVFAWDGVKATGPQLFESGNMSTNGGSGFQAITINTGGINLTGGQAYVAFFSASKLFDGIAGNSQWGLVGDTAYADGTFVYSNNGSDFSALTSTGWSNFGFGDLAFRMDFSEPSPNGVPEPASIALIGFGLAGLGAMRRRSLAV